DSGTISKTQTKATPSGLSSLRTSSKGGPGCHFTMRDSPVQARLESKQWEAQETAKHRMEFSTAGPQTDDEETLAETLLNIKRSATKDKRKAIMQESESPKKIKKKKIMQISFDEEIAQRFYEEEQAEILRDAEYSQQIQADKDLAQRMLEEEKESLSIKERSRLLTEFIDKRKKMLAAKRAEEKRNKPPTQAQQRTYMSNYLKNMGGYTLKQLKQYSFEEIKILFDNTMESIRRFVPIEKEEIAQQGDVIAKHAEKESSKKARGRLKRKTSKAREDKDKRQKKQDDPEKLTLMEYVEVISDSEEVINVIPLAVKSPIVSWKSYCNGDVGYYEIHTADGSYKTYIFFSEM
nr:hypothetical protein [Tanacetum cinerariifolium]